MENKILQNKGQLCIRAYCTKCGEMLMESNMLTKKQLHTVWDRAVLQAVNIKCEKCGLKFPNFEIELRIANKKLGCEYKPTQYIKAKHKEDPVELFTSISKQWLKEHPDATPPTKQEIIEAVKKQRERLNRNNHGEGETNEGSNTGTV